MKLVIIDPVSEFDCAEAFALADQFDRLVYPGTSAFTHIVTSPIGHHRVFEVWMTKKGTVKVECYSPEDVAEDDEVDEEV